MNMKPVKNAMHALKNPSSAIPEGRSSKNEMPTIIPAVNPMVKLKNLRFLCFTMKPIAPPIVVDSPATVVIIKAFINWLSHTCYRFYYI